jgi:ribosomal protein L20
MSRRSTIMTTAQHYRTQAGELYRLSRENTDRAAAFAQILKATDCEAKAAKLERGDTK